MENGDFVTLLPPNNSIINNGLEHPIMYDEMLFIDINNKGSTIVGASSLTDTYWESCVYLYDDAKATTINKYRSVYNCSSTIGEAKFFTQNQILAAKDYLPSLELLSVTQTKEDSEEVSTNITLTHSVDTLDRINTISTWSHTKKAVTGSGNYISVWNIDNGKISELHEFKNFHTDIINDVDTCHTNEHVLVSVSRDRRACLWDIRTEKAAKVLYQNEFSSLTATAFSSCSEHDVYIASEAGDIYDIDIRQPNEFVSVTHCYDSYGIYRMTVNLNTEKGGMLAVCGDGPEIKVYNCNKGGVKLHYSNSTHHTQMVRGLAWSPENSLYSCGYNQEFVEHLME